MSELISIAAVLLAYSLVSGRLQRTVLTAPIFFVISGIFLGSRLIRSVDLGEVAPFFLVVGVVALSLSFFNQAARINPALDPMFQYLPLRAP